MLLAAFVSQISPSLFHLFLFGSSLKEVLRGFETKYYTALNNLTQQLDAEAA